MRNLAVLLTLALFSLAAFAQTPKPKSRNYKNPVSAKNLAGEKEEFDRAVALADAAERVAGLRKFVKNFPKSKEKIRALELITSGRAALADEKLRAGEKDAGVELFKLAVRETPKPVSDKLFAEVVLQIPNSLFLRGERRAAIEIARLIEEKADGNAKQLLGGAAFYLAMENAADAKRLIEKAVALDANLPAAYQTLGLAHRLDFQLEESANAYQKALELDADSTVSRRSLAEMKRATGKATEAVALYREILAKDANDVAAQTGLTLALFDAENKTEAESEMQKSLAANANNLLLLVGAAYWYAARDDGARAIELAEKAVNIEPRYIWGRVALARGLMQQKRLMEAEKALLAARQYGDFPTLDYELATARFQSGFYREAAEGLRKKFLVADGIIKTRLGGRVAKEAKNFTDLLAAERRASIFQTLAADNAETADKMKSLLDFSQKLDASGDEPAVAAADEFVKGDDRMKLHRQLFAADQLLQKRKALPKVYELTKAAIGGVDPALDAPHPAAAVLADELYQSRRIAISRNELVIVPDVPRQTLSNILRGRIEDIAGWTLFHENKSAEAVTRLKRAVSVLPEKSSWWRGSMWRLGAAHAAAENHKDALEAYIKSYASGEADAIKYGVIETVYQKVNGSTDGLELKIGAKPASVASAFPVQTEIKTTELPKSTIVQSAPEIISQTTPTPNVAEITEPIAETKPPAPEISDADKTVKVETAPTPKTEKEVENREPQIEETPAETKTEAKPNPVNQVSENTSKAIFEPIVINVPKIGATKNLTAEAKPEEKKPIENAAPQSETKTDETVAERKLAEQGEIRPRVVVTENTAEQTLPCKIMTGQEIISILNGGNLSVLVRFEDETDAREIKATSSSLADVEIVAEPLTVGISERGRFFIVKSISQKTGTFAVTFEAACGKKEISVKVR